MQLYKNYVGKEYDNWRDFIEHYTVSVPENFNFVRDVIDVYAKQSPEQLALLWCDDNGGEEYFSFARLAQQANLCAAALQRRGIKKGDRILSILRQRYEYWILLLACHKLGAVIIPANYMLMEKDIIYRLEASDAVGVVCLATGEVAAEMDKALTKCPKVALRICVAGRRDGWLNWDDAMAATTPVDIEVTTQNDDPLLIYFTSGTEGQPKMVLHDMTYPLGHLATGVYWHQLADDDIHLTWADSGWAKCSWGKSYGQWLAGACNFVYDVEKVDYKKVLTVMAKYRITSFCAPPTMFRFMIKEDMAKYDLSALRHGSTAGEALNPSVLDEFLAATGVTLREAFGQTETGVILGHWLDMPVRVGTLGMPNPQYRVGLLDPEGKPCEVGEEGEVCIAWDDKHPLGVLVEYFGDADRTANAIHDGWYRTGDIAWCDEDGYYTFVGRSDDIIKSSGYRIGPFEVESALTSHQAVTECAITGVPHPDRGQVVKATIILSAGYEPSPELIKELQDYVKHTTAPYKYPRIIEFAKELPKTFSGKTKRKHIRETDAKEL